MEVIVVCLFYSVSLLWIEQTNIKINDNNLSRISNSYSLNFEIKIIYHIMLMTIWVHI